MNRDTAVIRIQDGLGFATRQTDKIILRLQEAQRELEMGKSLPRFLVQEDQTLTIAAGTNYAVLPTNFLRVDDSYQPFYRAVGNDLPTYLTIKRYETEARQANFSGESSDNPTVMVLRKFVAEFINPVTTTLNVTWQYFKRASVLTGNIENEWLADTGAPEWLIGEAGYRMAKNLRDKDAMADFDDMRKTARAAVLGEIIEHEESTGPLIMGANL
jgi:hypothetical protein